MSACCCDVVVLGVVFVVVGCVGFESGAHAFYSKVVGWKTRINLPAPLRGGQIGIPAASGNIAATHLLQVIMHPHEIGHVVGEAEEV